MMKSRSQPKAVLLLFAFCCILLSCTQKGSNEKTEVNSIQHQDHPAIKKFDSVLADEYGADEYGMKKYVFAFLKRGPNRDLDSVKKAELQMAHLQNITRMAEEGKLVLAGPFFGNDDLRGIYIFNVETIEEAENLTNSDPAIAAGSLVMELKEWYGSAALIGVNDLHESLMKKEITTE